MMFTSKFFRFSNFKRPHIINFHANFWYNCTLLTIDIANNKKQQQWQEIRNHFFFVVVVEISTRNKRNEEKERNNFVLAIRT